MLNRQEGRLILDKINSALRRAGIAEVDENEAILVRDLAIKVAYEKGPIAMTNF